MKHFLVGLLLAVTVSSAAYAAPMPLREVAQRAAAERHCQLIFEDSINQTVDVDPAHPQHALATLHLDTYKLGSTLVVGTKPWVAHYRDVVTTTLQVQPGHEDAVAAQISHNYLACDTSVDHGAHQVTVKAPRFMYVTMKMAVAQIDANLTATGP